MNAAQLHLMFNHWPLMLLAVGFVTLLIGETRHNNNFTQYGLFLFLIAAVATALSQFTGEGAHHLLMDLNLAEHDVVEKHEGMAFWSSVLTYIIAVLSIISLIMVHNTHKIFGGIRKLILILALAGFVLMSFTAHSGGLIRHTEISTTQTTGN